MSKGRNAWGRPDATDPWDELSPLLVSHLLRHLKLTKSQRGHGRAAHPYLNPVGYITMLYLVQLTLYYVNNGSKHAPRITVPHDALEGILFRIGRQRS